MYTFIVKAARKGQVHLAGQLARSSEISYNTQTCYNIYHARKQTSAHWNYLNTFILAVISGHYYVAFCGCSHHGGPSSY